MWLPVLKAKYSDNTTYQILRNFCFFVAYKKVAISIFVTYFVQIFNCGTSASLAFPKGKERKKIPMVCCEFGFS